GGTIVTCGATAGKEVRVNLWPFFVKQQRVIGSYGRSRADVEAIMEWAAYGKVKPMVQQTYPLERLGEAFESLRSRAVMGKVVVTP
ncbi:MAG TPA: zinc-binding dehydrogenase, partial [Candidatus Kapabacteria bacterium]|nr:zinc-binding dehydrogenase [Candidatus Kapabacteria bacterium]